MTLPEGPPGVNSVLQKSGKGPGFPAPFPDFPAAAGAAQDSAVPMAPKSA